jgi:hypothetical protein
MYKKTLPRWGCQWRIIHSLSPALEFKRRVGLCLLSFQLHVWKFWDQRLLFGGRSINFYSVFFSATHEYSYSKTALCHHRPLTYRSTRSKISVVLKITCFHKLRIINLTFTDGIQIIAVQYYLCTRIFSSFLFPRLNV